MYLSANSTPRGEPEWAHSRVIQQMLPLPPCILKTPTKNSPPKKENEVGLEVNQAQKNLDLSSKTSSFQYEDDNVVAILSSFGRTTKSLLDDVAIIRSWLQNQHHLTPPHPCNRLIASFLIRNKFSIEKTKDKIEFRHIIRTLIPEFYRNRLPSNPEVQSAIKMLRIVPLPKLTDDLNRVCVFHVVPNCSGDINVDDFMSYLMMFLEIKSLVDVSMSDEYIGDFKDVSLKLATSFTPMHIKKELAVFEKVYSNRIKKIHFVNMNPAAIFFLQLVVSLMPKKLKERIYLHKDYDSLMKCLPKKVLPKDFGGEQNSLDQLFDECNKLVETYEDYLTEVQNLEVIEHLRPPKLQNDDILGYYGSFRKLAVD